MPVESPPFELVTRYWDFYQYLVPRLKFVEATFPTAIATSWYRSPARNLQVGGEPRSQHLLAFAADFGNLQAGERQRLVDLARHLGMVGVDEGDHVHLQMFPRGTIPASFFPSHRSV